MEVVNQLIELVKSQNAEMRELIKIQNESIIKVVELFVTNQQNITPELLQSLTPQTKTSSPRTSKPEQPESEPTYKLTDKETLLNIYKINKSGELELHSEAHIKKQIKILADQFAVLPHNEVRIKHQNEVFKSFAATLYGLAHESIHSELYCPMLHINEADIMAVHECLNFVTQTPLVDWFFELVQEYVSKNLTLDGEYDIATETGYNNMKKVSQDFLSNVEDEICEALPDIPEHILNTMIWRVERTHPGFEDEITSPLESTEIMFKTFGPFDKYNNQYDLSYEEFLKTLNTEDSNRRPMHLSVLSAAVPTFHLGIKSPRKKRYIASEGNIRHFNRKTVDTQYFISGKPVSGRVFDLPTLPHVDIGTFFTAKIASPAGTIGTLDTCQGYSSWFEDKAAVKIIESIVWKNIHALPQFNELQKLAERYLVMMKRYNEAFA